MAATLDDIKHIFDEASVRYKDDEERNLIHSQWRFGKGEEPLTLLAVLLEHGELLQLRVPKLLMLEEGPYKTKVMRAMLDLAYRVRFVQFEYDPRDGEISTCVDISIEDGTITDKQVLGSMSVLLDVSVSARKRLRTIIATGVDPVLDLHKDEEDDSGNELS